MFRIVHIFGREPQNLAAAVTAIAVDLCSRFPAEYTAMTGATPYGQPPQRQSQGSAQRSGSAQPREARPAGSGGRSSSSAGSAGCWQAGPDADSGSGMMSAPGLQRGPPGRQAGRAAAGVLLSHCLCAGKPLAVSKPQGNRTGPPVYMWPPELAEKQGMSVACFDRLGVLRTEPPDVVLWRRWFLQTGACASWGAADGDAADWGARLLLQPLLM